MQRIYEVKVENKKELTKILESDPYADDSFARIGYRIRDGVSLGGEKDKIYVYISASEYFVKGRCESKGRCNADDRRKGKAYNRQDNKGGRKRRIGFGVYFWWLKWHQSVFWFWDLVQLLVD